MDKRLTGWTKIIDILFWNPQFFIRDKDLKIPQFISEIVYSLHSIISIRSWAVIIGALNLPIGYKFYKG